MYLLSNMAILGIHVLVSLGVVLVFLEANLFPIHPNLEEEKKVKPVVDKEKLQEVVFTAGSIAISGSLNRWIYIYI